MSLVVLKVGGASAAGAASAVFGLDRVCVVHGAGPQISAEMQRRGLPVEFVAGRRVTTAAGLEVVRESFAAVNAELCAAIPGAVGLMGDEIGLPATQVPELGLVGEPLPSAPQQVLDVLAVGLGADRISFLTDVPGLLYGGSVVRTINADDAQGLLDRGELEGGILPKLRAAVIAARLGVHTEIGATAVTA